MALAGSGPVHAVSMKMIITFSAHHRRLGVFSGRTALAAGVLSLLGLGSSPARAQGPVEEPSGDVPVQSLDRVDVIGQRERDLDHVPGSAHVVTKEDLEHQTPTSGNEALRVVPGVHVKEEEGLGLRPNIGFRGLNPDRSRKILVLEDGVPVALAPYGEPELYYAPSIERMQRLEVVKGSGSILWGPQTIGGVLNYISKDPPKESSVGGEARVGNFGYVLGEVHVGDTVGNVGYRVSLLHKRFGGHRSLNAEVTDATAKFRLELSPTATLGLKLQVYDEFSHATYLGLTRAQYETDPSAQFAVHDRLPVRRYAAAATHSVLLDGGVLVQTTLYGSHTTRNWRRQNFDRAYDPTRSYDRIIDGQGRDVTGTGGPFVDNESVFFRDSSASRNRAFTIGGIEPRATWDYALGGPVEGELVVGTRLHTEHTSEQHLEGQFSGSSTGILRDDERRRGFALAGYIQNRVSFDRLRVSPGLRVESFWYDRKILRQRVADVPADMNPPLLEGGQVFAAIPGLGVSYDLVDGVTLFSGVHRGFAPPRTKDAITNDGDNLRLGPEYSWNYEAGVRGATGEWFWAEGTGFLLDFSNQVIQPSEAGGSIASAEDAPELLNGGRSRHYGAELSATVDWATLLRAGFELPVTATYTWVHAQFGSGWRDDWVGNRLPYAPEHMASGQVRFVHPTGISAQVNANYVSSQFTDAANTQTLTADGLQGRIPGRILLDARTGYTFGDTGFTAYIAGKNLTDERYIASLAPQGIQPGLFRQVFVGVSGDL